MVIYISPITFYVAVEKFFNILLAFPSVTRDKIAFLATGCVLVAILNLLNAMQVLAYENVMMKLLSKNVI